MSDITSLYNVAAALQQKQEESDNFLGNQFASGFTPVFEDKVRKAVNPTDEEQNNALVHDLLQKELGMKIGKQKRIVDFTALDGEDNADNALIAAKTDGGKIAATIAGVRKPKGAFRIIPKMSADGKLSVDFKSNYDDLKDLRVKAAEAGVSGVEDMDEGQLLTAIGTGTATKVKQQKLGNATKLRKEFIDREEVKDYITVSTNVNAMDALLQSALAGNQDNKLAVDQGLITMYNKLTDPQSVVRESEYARTPENLPVVNSIVGAIQKVKAGGAGLTDADRKALVLGAKIIANERGKTYNVTLEQYNELATDYELDPNIVTRSMQAHQPYDFTAGGGGTPQPVPTQKETKGVTREQAIAELKRRGKI